MYAACPGHSVKFRLVPTDGGPEFVGRMVFLMSVKLIPVTLVSECRFATLGASSSVKGVVEEIDGGRVRLGVG